MIKIVALKTVVVKTSCSSKTLVNIFQLAYVIVTLIIIVNFNESPQQLFYLCTIVLFLLFVLRLGFKYLPIACGQCGKSLEKGDKGECSECGCYNAYDLKLWSKLQFNDAKAARKAEVSRFIQNIVALMIVLVIFLSPLGYFFLVIDKDIHQLNQKRRVAFTQIRPAFLKYKTVHDKFPSHLNQLVPNYITEIPSVLIASKNGSHGSLKIDYTIDKNNAKFIFYLSHVPLTSVIYDIETDKYEHNYMLTKLLW